MTPRSGSDRSGAAAGDRIAAAVSAIAVLGMLSGSLVIVADILLRAFAGTAVVALNEVLGQLFAVAIAATLPAGAVRRVNLKVDLLAAQTGPALAGWLTAAGSLLMALFFGVLAWFVLMQAFRFHEQGRATLLLNWPLAPTGFLVSGALALSALAQLRNAVTDVVSARRLRPAGPSGWPVRLLVGLFCALVGSLGTGAVLDPVGLSRIAFGSPAAPVLAAFLLLWLGVFAQLPLAALSGLTGLAGTALMLGLSAAGNVWATDVGEFLSNSQIATLPLFLLMGSFAAAAGVSDDIYRLANALLGRVRGGLAYATVAGCAGFGAVCGSSVATAATFGRIALPQMAARAYAPELSTGVVAAGGTLGALVPPSGALILFALLTEQSISALFAAAMLPALLALVLYFGAVFAVVRMRRDSVPETGETAEPVLPALRGAIPVVALFSVVIGGLYGGLFTTTESAAVGAAGAFLLALLRGRLGRRRFLAVMAETTATTALIYGLILGALIFSFFVNLGQMPDLVTRWIAGLDLAPAMILMLLLAFYLALGAVMDSYAVMVITVPVVTPIVLAIGYDIHLWGVLMLLVVEMGLITPPFGLNLFVLKALQPGLAITRVMRGVVPFILADLIKILLLMTFPQLALWLPSVLRG
ncbi:MAG: hypothetical protein KatS3mg118_1396 [Paracoccaceae bacterium]|nr:MAG: hypothetical protein KatS3mg118_1396 [Paracoccaceae bacterium]